MSWGSFQPGFCVDVWTLLSIEHAYLIAWFYVLGNIGANGN